MTRIQLKSILVKILKLELVPRVTLKCPPYVFSSRKFHITLKFTFKELRKFHVNHIC